MVSVTESIFLDFRVPNATTWFYLSLVLTVGLFFRFNRTFTLRNWDLLALFLLVPALLFLREAQETRQHAAEKLAERSAAAVATSAQCLGQALGGAPGPAAASAVMAEEAFILSRASGDEHAHAEHLVWLAYLCLLIGSLCFLVRCLIDLTIIRRPVFIPNLNAWGLAWLGLTLLVVLSVRTLLPPAEPVSAAKSQSVVLEKAADVAAKAAEKVNQTVAPRQELNPAFWIKGAMAIVCHVAVVLGLFWIGWRHFHNSTAGVAAAVLYLLLPYTAYHVKDIHHVFPAALLVLAIACYPWPTIAGLLLGSAAAMTYFPLLLFPLWIGFYRKAGMGRFTLAFSLVLAGLGVYLLLDQSLRPELYEVLNLADWRAWDLSARPTGEGLWTGLEVHYAYRVPLFIGYLALVATTMFWPSPKNLGHVVALSAALILGVQFWYADAGGIYVLWYLPLLVLVCIRPNLSERFAFPIDPEKDWLSRLRRWVNRPPTAKAKEPVTAAS